MTAPAPVSDSTETLAREAAAGSKESLAALYQGLVDTTYRWSYNKTRDHATAEDLTSEVWQKVIRVIDQFVSQGPGSFVRWLYTITQSIVCGHFRLRGRRREQFTADMLDLDSACPEATPAQVAERRELAERLARTIRRLPARQAECLRLRFYNGLSLAETAAILEIDDNAVKQLQHRALSKLRLLMPQDGVGNLLLSVHATTETQDS